VLGLIQGHKARFVRTYINGYGVLQDALSRWAEDVRGGAFPGSEESYRLPESARSAVEAWQAPAPK
jgi:3-methyl-2-oxobutanoate hydroxymethyltransferase